MDNQNKLEDPQILLSESIREKFPLTVNEAVDVCMKFSGFPEKWIAKRFDQLTGDKKYIDTVTKIIEWDFKDPIAYTILSKANGVGKTHMGVSLCRKYIYQDIVKREGDTEKKYYTDIFVTDATIYRKVQESYRDKSFQSESEIIERYAKKKFLVIDDLFSSRDNDFARRIMLEIINLRLDWYGLPTFITSNLNRKEIREIDTRIDSRLNNGIVIELQNNTEDRRKG
jgi:chromosomal replication initiation ATPase DnaA